MKPKQPKAPNPYAVSAAQTKSNQDTALFNANLNRVDQTNPYGSSSWSHEGTDPATGWSQSTSLSPQMQSLFDSQTASQQGISDAIGGAVGRLPTSPFDASGINVDDVRRRSFDSQMAMLAPQFDKGARQLEGQMSDRGIPIGAEIWNDQQGEYNRAKDSSMLGAARQADLDAGNEQSRQFNQMLTEYNQPYQALGSLMGNSQAVGTPQFSGVPQSSSAGTDVAGNIWNKYAADQQAYQQNQSNLMSGLLGIGKLGIGAATGGLGSMLLPQLGPGMGAFG